MIYLFLAEGFEEIEALTPVDILRRGGVEVVTAGVGATSIRGSHGIVVKADTDASGVILDGRTDGVILPGGMPGTINLEADRTVMEAVRYCSENGKLIGAICAAPSILGHSGILKGKKATCYPSFESELDGAILSDDYVVQDGNIVTAKGMGVSAEFALRILSALKGEEAALRVKSSIQSR